MTRLLAAVAAIAALILIFVFFTGEDPAERTDLPAADAPGAALESAPEADAEMEVNPQPGDPALETETIEPGVGTREPDEDPLDVTIPEGEAVLTGDIDAPEDEEETGVAGEDEDPQR